MKVLFTLLFIFINAATFAQKYSKAIVTDLNYLRRFGAEVTALNFPFYFQEKEFVVDVQQEVRRLVKEKFGVGEVLFLNPDSIFYADMPVAAKTQAKEFGIYSVRDSTLYISVETILQFSSEIDQDRTFKFTTRVEVYNGRGKKVYAHKNHIPFTPYYGDEIAGSVDLSMDDFYAFYFDGLFYAFEGNVRTVDKRYVAKPVAQKYFEEIQRTSKYYLHTQANGYAYGKDYNDLSELLHFTINYWDDNNEVFEFSNLVTVEFLDGGYNLINKLDGKEYQVRMKGGVAQLQNIYEIYADIKWELLEVGEGHIGDFVYSTGCLKGAVNEEPIQLIWKGDYSCLEVYAEEKRIALVNYDKVNKTLFLSRELTREQLINLVNSLFIYDYARAVRFYIITEYR